MQNKISVRATLVELFNRVVKVPKNDKERIYRNGENNLYPYEIDAVINNSPTAKRCSELFSTYLGGKLLNDLLVNEDKGIYMSDVIQNIAKSTSKQKGVYIHVRYGFNDNGKIVPVEPSVLEYNKMRNSKEDDEDFKGWYWFADWDKKDLKDKDKYFYYAFNKNEDVIKAQIKADYKKYADEDSEDYLEMIKAYRGQVYYLNFDEEYQYALSPIDPAYNDADTEYRISLYANTQSRLGFLGKMLVLTQGLDEETSERVKRDISDWLGSENSGGVYHLAGEQIEDLNNLIKIEQLKPQFEDKLFEFTQKRIKENIIGCYGIPSDLLESNSAIFDGGSSKFKELKLAYCEYVRPYQLRIERVLRFMGFDVTILPLETREQINEVQNENN